MRLPSLLLTTLALVTACGARTPIEYEGSTTEGAFCPTSPSDGQPCPTSQDGCTFFLTDVERGCVTAATCRCSGGRTVGCATIGVCSTGGGNPLDRCAPGLLCGGTRFGCAVESCGRSCSCGPDGRWQCAPDSCDG